jgi:hypothetical protein
MEPIMWYLYNARRDVLRGTNGKTIRYCDHAAAFRTRKAAREALEYMDRVWWVVLKEGDIPYQFNARCIHGRREEMYPAAQRKRWARV